MGELDNQSSNQIEKKKKKKKSIQYALKLLDIELADVDCMFSFCFYLENKSVIKVYDFSQQVVETMS